MQLDTAVCATMFAALRHWQDYLKAHHAETSGYFSDVEPLTTEEIDGLCEELDARINCNTPSTLDRKILGNATAERAASVAPDTKTTPRVLVVVESGCVSSLLVDGPILAYIKDWDNIKEGDQFIPDSFGDGEQVTPAEFDAAMAEGLTKPTHEVVDFGPDDQDETQGYPFEGTEAQCSAWITTNQQWKPAGIGSMMKPRYAMQEIPED